MKKAHSADRMQKSLRHKDPSAQRVSGTCSSVWLVLKPPQGLYNLQCTMCWKLHFFKEMLKPNSFMCTNSKQNLTQMSSSESIPLELFVIEVMHLGMCKCPRTISVSYCNTPTLNRLYFTVRFLLQCGDIPDESQQQHLVQQNTDYGKNGCNYRQQISVLWSRTWLHFISRLMPCLF